MNVGLCWWDGGEVVDFDHYFVADRYGNGIRGHGKEGQAEVVTGISG